MGQNHLLISELFEMQLSLHLTKNLDIVNGITKNLKKIVSHRLFDSEDPHYSYHCYRVAKTFYDTYISMYNEKPTDNMLIGAYLHDIGKIHLKHLFFDNEKKFTEEERLQSQSHTVLGYQFLYDLFNDTEIANFSLVHHQRTDHTSYPDLFGMKLKPEHQLIATVDPLVAILEKRKYRQKPIQRENEFLSMKDSLFHPYYNIVSEYLLKQDQRDHNKKSIAISQ